MQRHKLLTNRFFTGSSQNQEVSDLVYDNDYYHNIQNVRGFVVNENNVRAFLNDSQKNEDIITDFFNYLKSNTTDVGEEDKFREVYYDDKKLAEVFNNYFDTSVLSGASSSSYFIYDELTDNPTANTYFQTIVVCDNNYNYLNQIVAPKAMEYIPLDLTGNSRVNFTREEYEQFYSGEAYYVPVYLEKTFNHLKRLKFQPCKDNEILETTVSSGYYQTQYSGTSIQETIGIININNNGYQYAGTSTTNETSLFEGEITYSTYAIIAADLIKEGFILTGSLALSKFGTVYRNEIPKDIDVYGKSSNYSIEEELIYSDTDLTGSFNYNYNLTLGQNVPMVPKGVNKILELYPTINKIKKISESNNLHVDVYLLYGGPVEIDFFAIRSAYIGNYNIPASNGLISWQYSFSI